MDFCELAASLSISDWPWRSRFLRDAGAELSEHSGAAGTAALLTGFLLGRFQDECNM